MKKIILSVIMMVAAIFSISAQMPQPTPLPLMPGAKSGVLPNGLTYIVMHNEEPKGRANFYIAQKVGSTLETKDQLGLAHFLEHMAFNGTTHYPGKNMLDYLQSKGIRFGEDINAYTDFDETVYNIDNVPTADKALMDSVLLVIRDWSDGILLETDEINAERGVIQEEWRGRQDATGRMWQAVFPQIYKEYQYQQTPIGLMDVVMNFEPDVLRAYYKKWYRPDQQGIVVVGDFDVDEMEQKVKELFSTVVMPEDAAERTYAEISDNAEPIFVTFEDPEIQSSFARISFKIDVTPWEFRNTVEGYIQDSLVESILSNMINNRLNEYSNSPECPYAYAGVWFGRFYVSKTKKAFELYVTPKGNDMMQAIEGAMAVVARACKTGFTESEYDRAKTSIISRYEALYNERNKTTNEAFGKELYRHFIDNEPAPGIEVEYQLAQQVYEQMLNGELMSQVATQLLTPENQVVMIAQPKQEGYTLPTREQVIPMIENTINAQYEAYVDEVITDPLIAKMRKPGKIKKEIQNPEWGTTEFILSNGVKVVVLPTDYADDTIIMNAVRDGGYTEYSYDQAPNALMIEDAIGTGKLGDFDNVKLRKYLTGKRARVGYSMNAVSNTLGGSSTVKDLPTLLELTYAYFTELNPDEVTYNVSIDKVRPQLQMAENNPEYVFGRKRDEVRYGHNPMMVDPNLATVEAADFKVAFEMGKNTLANAADYTFFFVGNVDINTLKPLLEKYIASLPSKGKPGKLEKKSEVDVVKGQVVEEFDMPMETPGVTVWGGYSSKKPAYSAKNDAILGLVGQIVQQIFTATLREEEGGTYSPGAAAFYQPLFGTWELIFLFQTNDEMKDKLIKRAKDEIANLLANGANAEYFNNVRSAAIAQLDINDRDNSTWMSRLVLNNRGIDTYHGKREALESVTLEELNAFMRDLYDGENFYEIIMNGKAVEK